MMPLHRLVSFILSGKMGFNPKFLDNMVLDLSIESLCIKGAKGVCQVLRTYVCIKLSLVVFLGLNRGWDDMIHFSIISQ